MKRFFIDVYYCDMKTAILSLIYTFFTYNQCNHYIKWLTKTTLNHFAMSMKNALLRIVPWSGSDLTYSVKSEHIPPELCETIKMELMITKLYTTNRFIMGRCNHPSNWYRIRKSHYKLINKTDRFDRFVWQTFYLCRDKPQCVTLI
jgi:hypothetical protein